MRNLGRVVVCIPARAGSKRVKAKNLRELCGQPLLAYAINSAKSVFENSSIYVNSDSEEMLEIGRRLGVSAYKRDPALASDSSTGDEFAIDFMNKVPADTCVMISPACPLVTTDDIRSSLSAFELSDCDTLITCDTTRMQTFCNSFPVNIDVNERLQPTQRNPEVSILNWAVTIWDVPTFKSNFNELGYAYIGTNRLLHAIPHLHGIKISTEEDFCLVQSLLKNSLSI
jgi:CMP-N-acetylneuraminic acid synthetase